MVASLSQSMMVTWSIALFEHLDAMMSNAESMVGASELISFSKSAWKLADASFPQIIQDANALYDEFRAKWMQRFSTEEVLRLLLEGGDFLTHDEEQGWALTVKNNKQDISAFYSATIHLLVSDAEPLFVRMHTPLRTTGWTVFLAICVAEAISALYEIIEWLASLSNPTDTEAFLGTQGYIWDTQSDMFMCLIGATLAVILWVLFRRKDVVGQ